jgi:NADH-quinone oxidoreductase E subunit
MLKEKYADRIEAIFAKYPDKRSAVMPLLYLAQEAYGHITEESYAEIGAMIGIDPTQVRSIAGFYTMFREEPKGKYWLQVCTDLPCALRGAEDFYQQLLDELGVEDGGTTPDGLFTVERVMCLAACDKAPMLQCNFHFHENLDMDIMRELIAEWRAKAGVTEPVAEADAEADAE